MIKKMTSAELTRSKFPILYVMLLVRDGEMRVLAQTFRRAVGNAENICMLSNARSNSAIVQIYTAGFPAYYYYYDEGCDPYDIRIYLRGNHTNEDHKDMLCDLSPKHKTPKILAAIKKGINKFNKREMSLLLLWDFSPDCGVIH